MVGAYICCHLERVHEATSFINVNSAGRNRLKVSNVTQRALYDRRETTSATVASVYDQTYYSVWSTRIRIRIGAVSVSMSV